MSNPYAAPKSRLTDTNETPNGVLRRKKYVVTSKDVVWPNRCFKCNAETVQRKKMRLNYVNPWLYLTLLINVLVTLILVLIFQKKFVIAIPLCELHLRKRKRFVVVQWVLLTVTIAAFAAGMALDVPILAAISGVFFLVVILLAITSRVAFIAKQKKDVLWIKGAGTPFLESLNEYHP